MMYLPPPTMTARKKRRGFNLIEAAIVLGVVGLVIGGIWVAASAVTKSMGDNETISGVLTGVDKLRKLYPPEIAGRIGAIISPTSRELVSMDVFPPGWYVPSPDPDFDTFVPPIGKNGQVRIMGGSYCAPRSPTCPHQHTTYIEIAISNRKDSCIKLALAFDQQIGKSIGEITINSSTMPSPLSTAQAAAVCIAGYNNLVLSIFFD